MEQSGITISMTDEQSELNVYKALTDWSNLIKNSAFQNFPALPYYPENTDSKKKEEKIETIEFPLIKRVVANTLALDLVSVQPLGLPQGLLMYMDNIEKENVYTRKVLVEKCKYTFLRDYFIPLRTK